MVRLSFLASLALAGCLVGCAPSGPPPTEPLRLDAPPTMLWTWERAEDLTFLDSREEVGVAHLVATVELHAPDRFTTRPNRSPLRLSRGMARKDTARIAVVRIENVQGREFVARLDAEAHHHLVDALVDASRRLDASGLQLDFDALRSQREFYARLLVDLRRRLPASRSLGVTALASWCVGDPWLADLPAGTLDYAVPMLFRMGPDAAKIRRFLDQGGSFGVELCRRDLGLSTDEPWPSPDDPMGEVRRWIFAPKPWAEDAIRRLNLSP